MTCKACQDRAEARRRWGENTWLIVGLFALTVLLWYLRDAGLIQ